MGSSSIPKVRDRWLCEPALRPGVPLSMVNQLIMYVSNIAITMPNLPQQTIFSYVLILIRLSLLEFSFLDMNDNKS